jgi:peptidoglycan lytic transglycosylase
MSYPRPFSDSFSESSKVGLFSSLAQSPDSAEPPQPSAPSGKHPVERRYAAFYSQSLEGHKTVRGGVYSSTKLTATHPTLLCGTKLRVTNLRNGKTVRVTVNDHLPTSHDRILDLSYAAAQALDFIPQGATLVKLEVLR